MVPTELHGLSITTANIDTLRWNTRVLSILGGEYQVSGGTEQPSLKVYYTAPTPTPTSTPTQTPTPTITPTTSITPTATPTTSITPTITPTTTITPTITSTPSWYYLRQCCPPNSVYRISQGSFAASPTGTYFIENDSNLPDGCYTFTGETSYISSTNFDGTTTGPLSFGCNDPFFCECGTPTPTPTPTNTVTNTPTNTVTVTKTQTPSGTPFSTPTPSPTQNFNFTGVSRNTYYFTSNNCDPTLNDEILKVYGTEDELTLLLEKL